MSTLFLLGEVTLLLILIITFIKAADNGSFNSSRGRSSRRGGSHDAFSNAYPQYGTEEIVAPSRSVMHGTEEIVAPSRSVMYGTEEIVAPSRSVMTSNIGNTGIVVGGGSQGGFNAISGSNEEPIPWNSRSEIIRYAPSSTVTHHPPSSTVSHDHQVIPRRRSFTSRLSGIISSIGRSRQGETSNAEIVAPSQSIQNRSVSSRYASTGSDMNHPGALRRGRSLSGRFRGMLSMVGGSSRAESSNVNASSANVEIMAPSQSVGNRGSASSRYASTSTHSHQTGTDMLPSGLSSRLRGIISTGGSSRGEISSFHDDTMSAEVLPRGRSFRRTASSSNEVYGALGSTSNVVSSQGSSSNQQTIARMRESFIKQNEDVPVTMLSRSLYISNPGKVPSSSIKPSDKLRHRKMQKSAAYNNSSARTSLSKENAHITKEIKESLRQSFGFGPTYSTSPSDSDKSVKEGQ